jgi:hypothetical protein
MHSSQSQLQKTNGGNFANRVAQGQFSTTRNNEVAHETSHEHLSPQNMLSRENRKS